MNKDLRHLRAMLKWCHRMHYLRTVPSFEGAFVACDRPDPVRVPDEDLAKVLRALADPTVDVRNRSVEWYATWVRVALFTGCRRGELRGLTWADVDFGEERVVVRSATSKGRRDRKYEGATDLLRLLRGWREVQGSPAPSEAVFPWPYPSWRQFYEDWKRIIARAGVTYFIPHDLRSTCVSQLLEAASSLVVKDWVGHASVTTTERHYANTTVARRKVAGERRVFG